MTDTLGAAARALGVATDQVLSYRIDDEEIVLVVDHGIAGGKKHRLPLVALEALDETPRAYEATEAAAELALAEGVDLGSVTGTGQYGRITLGDVKRFMRNEED